MRIWGMSFPVGESTSTVFDIQVHLLYSSLIKKVTISKVGE